MIPKEIFQTVKKIEISTSRLVTDVFAGQYHSVFKGQGIEFDEVREYQFGDDIRTIDWNVTARTGHPYVKKFTEERELTVMILVDASWSCQFATVNDLKSKLAAEISALLALAAIRNNDKVGLIIFTDEIEKFIPPRKGKQHVLRVIREILYFKPKGRATNVVKALEYLSKVTTRKSIAFLISDFIDQTPENEKSSEESFKKALSIANKRHDLIAITLNDPREIEMPDCGVIVLEDSENGSLIQIDSSQEHIRKQYNQRNISRIKQRDRLFRLVGMDYMNISTKASYSDEIIKFFLKRRRKIRR